MGVTLNENLDRIVWKLTSSRLFSVRSLYAHMMNGHTIFLRKYIWKLKVPLKFKIFMWFLHRNVILTKDNLAKQNWTSRKKCAFCDLDESINHLFFDLLSIRSFSMDIYSTSMAALVNASA
jgi:hypothetical protein